jgi:MtN3 and saliva related transmembrane protein
MPNKCFRKRNGLKVAKALQPSAGMNWTQVIGLFAGICTSSSLLPQLIKTIKEKKAEDISKLMLFVLMTGVATWVVYGFLRNDLPIILTNSFSLLLNVTMLVLRFKYSRKGK